MKEFNQLLENSKKASSLQKLQSATESNTFADEREWKLKPDSDGNGQALIRFLPKLSEEGINNLPFVQRREYFITEGNKRPFIAFSPSSLGPDHLDPIFEHNQKYWQSPNEDDRKIARRRSATLRYYTNILVLKDPEHPSNEGKVFIFKFGKKIFDKIKESMTADEVSGRDPLNPFDLSDDGADFALKMSKVSGFNNYDNSTFTQKRGLSEDAKKALMSELKRIGSTKYAGYDLDELLNPDLFMSYSDMKTAWLEYIGENNISNSSPNIATNMGVSSTNVEDTDDSYHIDNLDDADLEETLKGYLNANK